MEICVICDINPAIARGRCGTCYQYHRRTGSERPERLCERQCELNARGPQGARRKLRALARALEGLGNP